MPHIYSSEIIYKEECYQIIGCAMEVHRQLGNGFLEAVYQEALEIELINNEIPYHREAEIPIQYKGQILKKRYVADFICFSKIIVEIKAISELTDNHYKQLFNYLKATGNKLGLLINFGTESLEYKRIIK
jgi:GxxExxY protein